MKTKHNYDLFKTFILIEKLLYKLRIIILFENANYRLTKTQMEKG